MNTKLFLKTVKQTEYFPIILGYQSCIELAKDIVKLQTKIKELKKEIDKKKVS